MCRPSKINTEIWTAGCPTQTNEGPTFLRVRDESSAVGCTSLVMVGTENNTEPNIHHNAVRKVILIHTLRPVESY